MEEPRFILLWRNPFDDISLVNSQLEPLTEREANRAMAQYFYAEREAGGDSQPIFKWQVVGEPVLHDQSFLDGGDE